MALANLAFQDLERGLEDPMDIILAMHKTSLAEGVGAIDCDVEDDYVQNIIWYARAGAGHQDLFDQGTHELTRVREGVLARIQFFQRFADLGRFVYPVIILAAAGWMAFLEPSAWLIPIIGAGALCFAGIFVVSGDPVMSHVSKRIRAKEARRQTARTLYLTGLVSIVMAVDEFELRTRIWNAITNPVARKRLQLEKPMPPGPQASNRTNRRKIRRARRNPQTIKAVMAT